MATSISWSQLLGELEKIASRFKEDQIKVDQTDRQLLAKLLELYESCRSDYEQYIHFSKSGYTKNLVRTLGSKCNIIIMCWAPLQASSIHGHAGSNCFVKVLEGSLIEQKLAYPDGSARSIETAVESTLSKNDLTFIDDTVGVHKVSNISTHTPAITLHIYLPAYTKARIFICESDLTIDKSELVNVEFSEQGEIDSSF